MSKTMASKSFRKRFKVTKTGKLMRRTQGQSHSRSNKSRTMIRRKDGETVVDSKDRKNIQEKIG